MDQPLVTIAIPTHNRADTYLRDALGCALQQTYPHLEIIVSDNTSTDGTRELVSCLRDERVRYLRHDVAIRPNDNFNYCIAQARGEYLLLLLDDEQVDSDFIESCLEAAGYRSEVGLIRTGLRTVDGRGMVIGEMRNEAAGLSLSGLFLAWFANRTPIYLCNTLINTDRLREAGGLHSRHNLFQDVMAQVRIAARAPRIDVRAIKASTRSHAGQFTYGARATAWAEDALDLLDLMCEAVPADKRDTIRAAGGRFFADISYSRASAIRSPIDRVRAYATVYGLFGRQHLPRARTVVGSTAIYRQLRQIKRRLKRQPIWAAAG